MLAVSFYFIGKVSDEENGKVSTRVMVGNISGGCLLECVLTIWCSF